MRSSNGRRHSRHAELFALTRLVATHASMYGAVDLESGDMHALLERALP
jgi:putative acyl-CoA dehydrogenase